METNHHRPSTRVRHPSQESKPVPIGSQRIRHFEQRPYKRPMLPNLRESGSIEQDSSLVMFLYREFVYNTQADPSHAELILA